MVNGDTTAREWWEKRHALAAHLRAPIMRGSARFQNTVRRLGSESNRSVARPNSRKSCGYVNIPEVRIDIHSAREHPALRRSHENCERVLDLSTIARLDSRLARVCFAIT